MIKRTIHGLVFNVERLFDPIFHRTDKGRFIDAYIGYTTPEHIILRGRVLSKLRHASPVKNQSRFKNFIQITKMFLTDEVPNATVRCGDITTTTDDEGYFQILLPNDGREGWSVENLFVEHNPESTPCQVYAPHADAQFMAISDIDDTVLKTGAYSLPKNLYTSFTGNSITRHIFPDAVNLMKVLSDKDRNPVFYVSSSPWNLHDFLVSIFENSSLVSGPKFLRDLGISKTKLITEGHGSHKGKSIDKILECNPDLPTILLGDTGQNDAKIYCDVIKRHPGRIAFVGLRTPGKGLNANDRKDLNTLSETGVPVYAETHFSGLINQLMQQRPDLIANINE